MPILGVIASEGLAPGAPTIGTATAGDASATVAYTAPTWVGKGSGAVTYTATSSPGGFTGTGTSPITVSGLTNGTAYTFTVKATTSYGVTGPSSAASNSITPATQSSYESIQTVTVGSGGQSTITFNSIPSGFKHLQLRSLIRGTTAAADVETRLTFNSDTSSNYSYHQVYGQGTNVPADGSANTSFIYYVYSPAANATSSVFGVGVMDILDYDNTNKYKTTRTLAGYDANGSGFILLRSGSWRNTNAITSINLVCASGNFAQYSQFALYGIK